MKPDGNLLLRMLEARRQGEKVGVASLCSANGLVLEAAFRSAAASLPTAADGMMGGKPDGPALAVPIGFRRTVRGTGTG